MDTARSETIDLHGGDMKLTPNQEAVIVHGIRGSITNRRWPNGLVIYKIESSLCKSSTFLMYTVTRINSYGGFKGLCFGFSASGQNYETF